MREEESADRDQFVPFLNKKVRVIRRGEIARTRVYDGNKIRKDKDRVMRHRLRVERKREKMLAELEPSQREQVRKRDERNSERARVAEYVIARMLPSMIPGAQVIRASEFDDRINGIDIVVLFRNAKGDVELAWGIDLTSAADYERSIERKMVNALGGLATPAGELSEIDYLEAVWPGGERELLSLERVPKAVLGLSENNISNLCELWLAETDYRSHLEGSPLQVAILRALEDAFRGQALLAEKLIKEGETQLRPALFELQTAEQRTRSVIEDAGLQRAKEDGDRTLTRIREVVYRSRVEMRRLYDLARGRLARIEDEGVTLPEEGENEA